MATSLFNTIRPLLCKFDFKHDIAKEQFYFGRASAYKTTMKLKTEKDDIVQTELRVVCPLPSGCHEEVSFFHRIIRRGDKIIIADPRTIFTHHYNAPVFEKVPAIFMGTPEEFKKLGDELIDSGSIVHFWAKDYLKEYLELIIEHVKNPPRVMDGCDYPIRVLRKQTEQSV